MKTKRENYNVCLSLDKKTLDILETISAKLGGSSRSAAVRFISLEIQKSLGLGLDMVDPLTPKNGLRS